MADNFKNIIAEVKMAYDIADYITQSGVNLKPNGAGKYKGLCPFHNEKSPSFTVNSHFANYHCFGCSAHGDLISYVQHTENLDFFEAIKKLAEDKNIAVDFGDQNQAGVDYKSLRECLKETANFFYKEYKKLAPDHPARKEVTDRGLSENKMLYGYAPEGRKTLYTHLKNKNFSDEIILQAGVCSKFEGQEGLFDFWAGRLMFFITDVTGKPIGFSGRKLYETDKRGKYVNSPAGPLFDKSTAFYNIAKAKKQASVEKKIYVNEGQFDVGSLVEASMTNAVASSGTAFTEKQAMILRRLVTEEGKIVFCFDGDEAGIKAALKVFTTAPAIHSQAEVVTLPDGQDPCDYRLEHGNEELKNYIESNSISIVEFVLAQEKKKYDLDDNVESLKYVMGAARILKTLTNKLLREKYARLVTLESFVSIEQVREAVKEAKSLANEDPTVEVEVSDEKLENRYEEVDEFTVETLEDLIKTNNLYSVATRLLAIAMQESTYVDQLKDSKDLLPRELHFLLDELSELKEEVIIPEHFSNPNIVEKLIHNEFFPFMHLEEKAILEQHFAYLYKRLNQMVNEGKLNNLRREIMQKLSGGSDMSAAFFERAIIFEERKLAAAKAAFDRKQ